MNKRIISVVLCFLIVFSTFGAGCSPNNNVAENSSSDIEEIYSSDEMASYDDISNISSEKISSDEYAFEEAPEGEEYIFDENGFGAYFPSFDATSSASSTTTSKEEDIFDIEDVPTFQNPSSVISSGDTASNSIYLDNNMNFKPLTAGYDSILDNNPDRGYRTELVLYIKEKKSDSDDPRTAYINDSQNEIRKSIEKVFNIYFKNSYSINKTFLAYIYITDFRDDNISKAAPVLEMFFKVCRERRVKSMLRFCYNNSYAKNFELSEENRRLLASECADQETILRHIKQLKPYISKYKDTIHTISCGFVGFVGEWAYSFQYPEVDYATIIKAIVEELCVPNNLYFSSRSPAYKEMLPKDYKYRNYVSHNNDAMYGEQTRQNWNSGDYQYGHSNGWWDYVTREGAYTPQDGEMYTNDALFKADPPKLPKGLDVILECAHHRHTSMSNWHGYLEALSRDNIIDRWIKNESVTTSWLNSKKILYDPNWFVDDNGNTVKRNPYEFLKAHLGYRLCAVDGHAKGELSAGSTLNLELNLKNYGFAAAYMLSSGFAILDSNFREVTSVKAGNPEKWYSHAPDNRATSTALTHTVNANIKLPNNSGKYYVAFYLKNTMNDAARLSNKMSFQNGYNILFSFNI